MTFVEFLKSRRKNAILFFLAGFFTGGILYYFCQGAAQTELIEMEENLVLWAAGETGFWSAFLYIIWERGKVLCVLWLAGHTKIYKLYIRVFILYIGLQSGFLLTFFCMIRGARGVLFWLITGFPQLLILIPLYFFSFYRIYEKRREKMLPAACIIVVFFTAACLLEARINIPLIQWMFTVW